MSTLLRRTIHPECKVLDAKAGIMEFVASDETIDSYKEIVRASGWRFSMLQKNAPFVADHDYKLASGIGKILEWKVAGKQLIETVQWAIGIGNDLADKGWKMYEAGFLKAVSVGFWPVKFTTQGEAEHTKQLTDMGIKADVGVRTIFTEQEQIELSAVVIGANPNAVARAYKAGIFTDADLETISLETAKRETASNTTTPADVLLAQRQAQDRFIQRIETALQGKGNQ
jgi:hypothetical protein